MTELFLDEGFRHWLYWTIIPVSLIIVGAIASRGATLSYRSSNDSTTNEVKS